MRHTVMLSSDKIVFFKVLLVVLAVTAFANLYAQNHVEPAGLITAWQQRLLSESPGQRFTTAADYLRSQTQELFAGQPLGQSNALFFLLTPANTTQNDVILALSLKDFHNQYDLVAKAFVAQADERSSLWSISALLAVFDHMRNSARSAPVLFVLLQATDDPTSLANAFIPFSGLESLLYFYFTDPPETVLLQAEDRNGQAPEPLLRSIRTHLQKFQVDFAESRLRTLFLRLGLLDQETSIDWLMLEYLPALVLGNIQGSKTYLSSSADKALVSALAEFGTIHVSTEETGGQYLRFAVLGNTWIISESILLLTTIGLFTVAMAILIFRAMLPWSSFIHTIRSLDHTEPAPIGFRKSGRFKPLFEALLVLFLFAGTIALGRFILDSLDELLLLLLGRTRSSNPLFIFSLRLVFYFALFFLAYGLLEIFAVIPKVRRSHALQAGSVLFLLDSLIISVFSFPHGIFFLLSACLMLTAGHIRLISLASLFLVLLPVIAIIQELVAVYYDRLLIAFISPSLQMALYVSLVCTPFLLWLSSLVSRRERFQRGSRSLIAIAIVAAVILIFELGYTGFSSLG